MNNDNPLIGNIDTTSSLTTDANEQKTQKYDLTDDYLEDKLVLLPVNAHTQHFYWNIATRDLQIKIINRFARFEVKIYILNGDKKELVDNVEIRHTKGNYYTYSTPNLKRMQAVLVMIDENGETQILSSNIITAPSSGFHASPWEIWMSKNGTQSTYASRASIDIVSDELLTAHSSLEMVIKEENLKARMGNFSLSNQSSEGASNHLFSSLDKTKGN